MNGAREKTGRVACLAVVGLLWGVAGAGCGASSKSSADADAVATVEGEFFQALTRAEEAATRICSRQEDPPEDCHFAIAGPRQQVAITKFSDAIHDLLDQGVGPECTEALEDALHTRSSLPSFPGHTAAVCRTESQR